MIGRWVRRGTLRLVRVCYGRFSGTRGAHSLGGNQSSVSTFTHLIISLESSSSIERTKKEKQRKRKGHIWHFTTAFFSTEPRPRRIAERRGSEWERERAREKPICERKKRLWWIERKTYVPMEVVPGDAKECWEGERERELVCVRVSYSLKSEEF